MKIIIDDREYVVDADIMTGARLMILSETDPGGRFMIHDDADDRQGPAISDEERITLTEGMRFSTIPRGYA